MSSITPSRYVRNGIADRMATGSAAELQVQYVPQSFESSIGFRRPGIAKAEIRKRHGNPPIHPRSFLTGRVEEGANQLQVVEIRKGDCLRQRPYRERGVHHVSEEKIVSGHGPPQGTGVERIPMLLRIIGE